MEPKKNLSFSIDSILSCDSNNRPSVPKFSPYADERFLLSAQPCYGTSALDARMRETLGKKTLLINEHSLLTIRINQESSVVLICITYCLDILNFFNMIICIFEENVLLKAFTITHYFEAFSSIS